MDYSEYSSGNNAEQKKEERKSLLQVILLILILLLPSFVVIAMVMISWNMDNIHIIQPSKKIGIIVFLSLAVLQFFALRKLSKPKENSSATTAVIVLMVFSGILYFFIGSTAYAMYQTKVCIDNGEPEEIEVQVNDKTIKVSPMSQYKITVPVGRFSISYKGSTVSREIGDANWVYNPGRKNTYVRRDMTYSTTSTFEMVDRLPDDIYVGNEEFFDAETDYLFDAPEKIKSKAMGDVSRTVLLHSTK